MRYGGEQTGAAAMPSSVIRNTFYDTTKNELWVTFVTGRRYVYADVPPEVFAAFKSSPSLGTFFNREIRDSYAYRDMTPERLKFTR